MSTAAARKIGETRGQPQLDERTRREPLNKVDRRTRNIALAALAGVAVSILAVIGGMVLGCPVVSFLGLGGMIGGGVGIVYLSQRETAKKSKDESDKFEEPLSPLMRR